MVKICLLYYFKMINVLYGISCQTILDVWWLHVNWQLKKKSDIQHWMYVLFSEHGVLQQSQFDAAERIHTGYCGTIVNTRKCQNSSTERNMQCFQRQSFHIWLSVNVCTVSHPWPLCLHHKQCIWSKLSAHLNPPVQLLLLAVILRRMVIGTEVS